VAARDSFGREPQEVEPTEETRILAKYIAMVVRNAMEDFHCEHLSDAQMRQLNPIIRYGICSALHAYFNYEEYENAKKFVDGALQMIPDYWEEPEIDPFLRKRSEWTMEELRELAYQQRPTVMTEDAGIIREVEIDVLGFDEREGETQVELEITTYFGNEDEHTVTVWSGVGPVFTVDPGRIDEFKLDPDDD
jgi:hypothetical protein